jgi:hypothetical protein
MNIDQWEMSDNKSINIPEGIALRMATFINARADISPFFPRAMMYSSE